MLIYEEYASQAAKRKAQRAGVKRGVASGKAKGYLFVFDEDGIISATEPCYNSALGELLDLEAGTDGPCQLTSCNPSLEYLQRNCRRVGFKSIPESWQRAFGRRLDQILVGNPELDEQRKRYKRIIALGKVTS